MASRKEAVDDLQEKLKNFISSTVKAETFDVVIPIMRKGLFLVDTLFPGERDFKIQLLDPIEDKLSSNIKLKGIKVLILDDSSRTGRTVLNAKESIIVNNSADETNIRVGVFMKHEKCQATIDYCSIVFDDQSGVQLYATLSDYFDSLCHQLDPDHLVIRGNLKSNSRILEQKALLSCLKKKLERFGDYYIQDSICSLWGRAKFTVADLRASDFELEAMSQFWKEEGVFKVRFCLEPNWTMYTVPIFCPEIITPSQRNHKDCGGFIKSHFCQWSSSSSDALCRDCLSFNLTRAFAEKFIPELKKELLSYGLSYSISEITWPEIQFRHEELQNKILIDLRDFKKKME